MAAQEKVPTPKEQEFAKERLSSCDRPTSATLASPFLRSTFGDLMSCNSRGPCWKLSHMAVVHGTVHDCTANDLQGLQYLKGLQRAGRLILSRYALSAEGPHQVRNVVSMQIDERLDDAHENVLAPAAAQRGVRGGPIIRHAWLSQRCTEFRDRRAYWSQREDKAHSA